MNVRPPFVTALRAVALPASAALLLSACAGAPPTGSVPTSSPAAAMKPQAPKLVATQPPSNLDAVHRFAWQQVVHMGDAFAAGDVENFLTRVSRGFYRGYGNLENSLRALLLNARAREAVVAVRLVTEEEGRVSVRAEWTRSVTLRDGTVDARHGETVFLFLKSDTSLRLLDYRGDAPFGLAGI